MFRDILCFYWLCLRRACSGKFWKAEKWAGGVGLVATAIIYFVEPSEDEARMIGVEAPLIFFAGVLVLIVGLGLIIAPYQSFKDEKDRADALDERQRPKLRVKPNAGLRFVKYASVAEFGDRRISQVYDWCHVAVIYATNDGRNKLEDVSCRMVAVWFFDVNQWRKLPIIESIELSFDPNRNDPALKIDIEPDDTVCIYLAIIYPDGNAFPFRRASNIPVDCQGLFRKPGRYQMLLQFRTKLPDPLQVIVNLNIKIAPQVKEGLRQPQAEVSILRQGEPPQWPEGIEEKTLR